MRNFSYKLRLIVAILVLILSIVAITGIFYPVKFLDTQFTALLQRNIVNFSIAAAVIFSAIVVITLLFGRFYCSTLCPFGVLQEVAALIFRPKNKYIKSYPYKYFIAAIVFGALIGGSALLIRYIDPYTLFGSAVSLSITGIIAIFLVLAIVFFKNRFFCTNICPVGALLGILSKISLNKIYLDQDMCVSCGLCEKECPSACINSKEKTVDNETCIKCLKCLGACKKGGVKFGIKPKPPVKFNPKRREIIIAVSALAVLGAAVKAGAVFTEKVAQKVRDIILPPGAKDANHMYHKCLNCNLCIQNCPNKILAKADDKFGAVHIDYSKGEGFCKYDCNECSKACPSGAINKISLEEKQKTRIAMAMIKEDNCTNCGACVYDCPVGAIFKINGKVFVNGTKCIGCGRCKKSCRHDAIEIFAVNEQRMV